MPEAPHIFHTEKGQGFPVVLIHGFCETHEIWSSFSEKLAQEFKVLAVDLPGFGRSNLLKPSFSIAQVATAMLHWLDAMHINQCIVIGHSLGGYVTLAMVEQQPERFKAFGLFHSTAFADSEEKKQSRNKVIEFVTQHGVAPFIESFIPPLFYNQSNPHIPETVSLALQTPKETLTSYVAAMRDRPDRTHVLSTFNRPILLLGGENDGVVSAEALRMQGSWADKAMLVIMSRVAHMGMYENETESSKHVLDFLRIAAM